MIKYNLKIFFISLILLANQSSLLAQARSEAGFVFLKNYSTKEYKAHAQNFAITQDQRGLMYIGNFSGILEFDGTSWRLIPTEDRTKVASLAITKEGKIFVGCRGEIGYLQPVLTGEMRFKSLMDKVNLPGKNSLDFNYTFATDEGVYFIASKTILLWDNSKMKVWELETEIKSSFHVNNKIIIHTADGKLMFFSENTLKPFSDSDYFFGATDIKAMIPINQQNVLVATANQGLFTLSNEKIHKFKSEADHIFVNNQITCGVGLGSDLYAFGTYRKGIIVIHADGKIKQTIDKQAGLQNENVRQIFVDKEKNLWAALNNGISLIDVSSPLTFYDESSGLKGGVTGILRFNDILYVTTYQGLFFYSPSAFGFKAIPGINTACWSIIPFNKQLLVASSQGVFSVKNQRANPITQDFSFCLHQSKTEAEKIYIGLLEGIACLEMKNGKWDKTLLHGFPTEEVRQIFEDEEGFLWAGTSTKGIFRFSPGEGSTYQQFGIEKGLPQLTGNRLVEFSNKIWVTSAEGIYHFNNNTHTFEAKKLFTDSLSNAEWINEIIEDSKGNLWTNSGGEKNISLFKKEINNYAKYVTPFLSVSDFVTWTMYPESEDIILFGGPDGLLRYDSKLKKNYSQPFNTLIRKVSIDGDSLIFAGTFFKGAFLPETTQNESFKPILSHTNNLVRFKFSAATFSSTENNEYQYMLEGFDRIWSEWSSNTEKEYTNLPKGSYTFRVRTRNIYLTVGQQASYHFIVLSAWYNTPYAYVMYVLLAAIIVYLIVRLRSHQLLKEKKALKAVIEARTAEVVQQKEEIEKKSLDLVFKNEELEKINNVVKSINSEIQFSGLLDTILEKTRIIKGMEKAMALILDDKSTKYRFKASIGWNIDALEKVQLTLDEAEDRYLINAEEVFEDIFYKHTFKTFAPNDILDKLEKHKSMLILVLKVENKVEGFLLLENMSKENAFDDYDIEFLKNAKEHIISAVIKTKILEDLQNTLTNLKAAQTQLVQSEKLASLGELTAGIAHEIQNPLNFVINFSSLSIDLADELKEYIEKEKENITPDTITDIDEVIEMLEGNVKKINNHGKRAGQIVKGMLEHSRGKSGEFVETELNKMISGYVNLAFHGMRAKDKSFSTAINTELDPNVGIVKVVPQDFSRVILNIINNGCYAVDQKKKKLKTGFLPEIRVTSKKIGDQIEIRLWDNGIGMPKEVIDKVFNPFFSTKPTGQGTGLGLSISYDIIAQLHKGTLEVNSKDGEFTEFIILIPANL